MEKGLIKLSLIIGMMMSSWAFGQVNVRININTQPDWGPSGYEYVEYYYLPDLEMYYCVPRRQYVYLSHGKWVYASALPSHCRGYNLYNGYKVVMYDKNPYVHFHQHKVKYAKYKHAHGKQKSNKDHHAKPGHSNQGHSPGHSGGKGKGHGNGHKKGHK